jgi:hypothetical protein
MARMQARRKILSAFIIFVLLQMAWLTMPALAAKEGKTTPPTTEENSLLNAILGMLESLGEESESEASPFEPPGFGGTPPGQGGTPPGQTNPPGHGGTPPGQSGNPPQPPGHDGAPPPGHRD